MINPETAPRLPDDMEKTAIQFRGQTVLAQYSQTNGGWITRDGFLAAPPEVDRWWSLSESDAIPVKSNHMKP